MRLYCCENVKYPRPNQTTKCGGCGSTFFVNSDIDVYEASALEPGDITPYGIVRVNNPVVTSDGIVRFRYVAFDDDPAGISLFPSEPVTVFGVDSDMENLIAASEFYGKDYRERTYHGD